MGEGQRCLACDRYYFKLGEDNNPSSHGNQHTQLAGKKFTNVSPSCLKNLEKIADIIPVREEVENYVE